MKFDNQEKLLILAFIPVMLLFAYLQYKGYTENTLNYVFAFAYGLIPLLGGCMGLFLAKGWHDTNKAIERAIFFLSLGLIAWAIGETIWSAYNLFLGVEVPYPSLADVVFLTSTPLWTIGLVKLAQGTGLEETWKKMGIKILFVFIPVSLGMAIYYALLSLSGAYTLTIEGGIIKLFFDIIYPTSDILLIFIISIIDTLLVATVLEQKVYRNAIIFLNIGIGLTLVADVWFAFASNNGSFYNGSPLDFVFALSVFFMSLGTVSMHV